MVVLVSLFPAEVLSRPHFPSEPAVKCSAWYFWVSWFRIPWRKAQFQASYKGESQQRDPTLAGEPPDQRAEQHHHLLWI